MAEAGSAAGGTVEDDEWWEGAYLELGFDAAILVVFFAAVAFHYATVETWITTTIAMTADTATAAIDGVTGAATKTLEISEAGLLVGPKKLVRRFSSDDEDDDNSPRRTGSRSPDALVRSSASKLGRGSASLVEGTFGGASGAVEGVGQVSKSAVRGTAGALERVTSSPRDAVAVAKRMEGKTAAGYRTTKTSVSHKFHVYMDRVLSNAARMPRSWQMLYLGGALVIVVLGFTVLLVVPFAFTLLLGLWSVTIVYLAPLRDLGEDISVEQTAGLSRDDMTLLATLNTAEAYLLATIETAQRKVEDETTPAKVKVAATYELEESGNQLAMVQAAKDAVILRIRKATKVERGVDAVLDDIAPPSSPSSDSGAQLFKNPMSIDDDDSVAIDGSEEEGDADGSKSLEVLVDNGKDAANESSAFEAAG